MTLGHPSERRLSRWIEQGRTKRTERHVGSCGLCEERLERITSLSPMLRASLEAALGPDESFEERMSNQLRDRLLDEETLSMVSELLGLGWQTSRTLFEEGEERDG